MRELLNNLAAKPHKLFFLGGALQALLSLLVLLLHYQGVLYTSVALPRFHAYSLIFAVFSQFFFGFLCTMFPRFLATPEIGRERYLPPFLLLNGSALLLLGSLYAVTLLTPLAVGGMLLAYLLVGRLLWQLYRDSSVTERSDVQWILLALAAGAVSHLLFWLSFIAPEVAVLNRAALYSGFFLYLFMLIVTLSQKMIPFFTENKVAGYRANRSPYFLHTLAGLLLLKVVLMVAAVNGYGLVDGVLFVVTLRELIRWRLPLREVEAMLWVLYLALAWMPLGFLLFFIEGIAPLLWSGAGWGFERVPLHTLGIGYFTTLLIGFATRIVMGHAGEKPIADRYAIGLFYGVQLVVLVRIVAGLMLNQNPAAYLQWISLSALLWLGLFLFWLRRYFGLLIRV